MSGPTRDRIGDFEVIESIGLGSRGRVFKARYAGTGHATLTAGQIVALKVFHSPAGDAKAAEKFRQQASVLKELNHPNIVQFIDALVWRPGEWDEVKCVVTEFLEGETLEDRLKRSPTGLEWPEASSIFSKAMAGLAYAAQKKILHRDVKPANIFITKSGDVKLIDFDVARRDEGAEANTAAWKGTFDYMAPDFLNVANFRGDEQSDIFSLGICLYESLVGKLPFEPLSKGAHVAYLNRWRGAQKPPDPSFRAGVFRVLANARRVVERSMAPAREHRYATFAQLQEDFGRIHHRRIKHGEADEYELQALLGRGGFGEVFYAERQRDKFKVAIKHLFAQKQSERFVREARLIQRCDHPHLVKYIDFFVIKTPTQEEQYYLVLEYLEGMPAFSLRYRIKKEGRLEVEEAIPLFVNFLDALGFLHEGKKPIIHRDIKPTNLYAPKGTPDKARIFDLGVARDVTGTVTTGGVPGTLDYMAPEFSKPGGDRGAPQSDIYAIGLCLYEALTGQPAFEKLPMEINAAWMEFQKRSSGPMAISFDAPVFKEYPRLANVVRRATAKEPEDRYATAAEMIKALQQSLSAAPAAPEEGATMATLATRTSAEQMPRLSDADSLEATPTPQPEPARGAGKAPDAGRGRSKPAPRREEAPTPASSRSSPIDSAALHAEEEQDEDAPVTGATRMEGDAGAGVAWAKLHRSRRKLFVIGGAAAGGVLVLVLLIWLISGFSAQRAAGRVDDIVNDLKGVRAEAAYVGELQAGIEQLRAYSDKYPGMKNDVRNGIQALESAARNVPVKFKDAFALASVEKNVDAAQALQKEWEGLRPYREFLGISQDDFEERLDYMTRTAGRIGFEGVAGKLTASLPDAITDDASLDVVEAAAAQYRDLAARTSESLSPEDRKRQLEPMRAALTRLAAGYVATLRADALEHMASGVDAEVELSTFKAAATRAPATIALARQAFDAAAAEIDSAQGTVRAQQETERLFASISAAVAPADFEAVVKQFMAWESSTANPPPADKVKAAVEAIKAKYRQWGESYYKKSRAGYEALQMDIGQTQQKNLQALIGKVAPRFGRTDLEELNVALDGLKKDAQAKLAKAEEQQELQQAEQKQKAAEAQAAEAERKRTEQVAESERRLVELQKKAAAADSKQLKDGVRYLAEFSPESLKVDAVKKAWQSAATDYTREIDEAVQLKDPVAERAARLDDLLQALSTKGSDAIFGAQAAAIRAKLDVQMGRFILRVSNQSDQSVTVSSGDILKKTVIGPLQKIDFTLPVTQDRTGVPVLVEGAEGYKPATKIFGLVRGGGQELKLSPLEKTETATTATATAGEGQGIFSITISPKDALVYLDDQQIQTGEVPVSSDENHKLRVEAPGYKTYEQYYRVGLGKTKAIDILLVREQKKKSGFF